MNKFIIKIINKSKKNERKIYLKNNYLIINIKQKWKIL